MAKMLGARRPAFTRKVLWIAATAIILVFAWAKAGFPCPDSPCQWLQMGPDGVLGMMPPGSYRPRPTQAPVPSGKSQSNANTFAVQRNPVEFRQVALPATRQSDLVLVQRSDRTGEQYKYVASASPLTKAPVYTVTREGKAWLTVTYNKSTGLYELTDPNGTGSPVLKFGMNPKYAVIPSSSIH